MPPAKTPNDYHVLAASRGFTWVGDFPGSTNVPTAWECSHKHQWNAPYNRLQKGGGCPTCYTLARDKSAEDYHVLAANRGFAWVGDFPASTHFPTTWECPHQHQWDAPYSRLQQGTGCPTCYSLAHNKTEADYHTLAATRDVKWVGEFPPTVTEKTTWECKEKHRWQAPYASLHKGNACPTCAGNKPKTAEDYRQLAAERGFEWIGDLPPSANRKTTWRCSRLHEWQASYNAIQSMTSCQICGRKAAKTVEDYHALAAASGIRWVGGELPTTVMQKTEWKCPKGHRWKVSYNRISTGTGCPVCAHRIPKTVEDYQTLAQQRGYKWLDTTPRPIRQKTNWECEKGHYWKASYGSIRQGHGCPKCARQTRVRKTTPKTAADYHALALARGFKWLAPFGKIPKNVTYKTAWECEKGHRWKTTYSAIRAGRGCPFCARVAPKSRDDYETLAEEHGIKLVGAVPKSSAHKTDWACAEGHTWQATFHAIQQGTGCPVCARLRKMRSAYSPTPQVAANDPERKRGTRAKLDSQTEQVLAAIVAREPTASLDWYSRELTRETGLVISADIISRTIFRLGLRQIDVA